MKKRIAFIGFRHSHIYGLYNFAKTSQAFEVAAVCEEDAITRQNLEKEGISFTHSDYKKLLDSVDCDVIAVGDYYARHGKIIISALNAGKHVITDKPVCTCIDEYNEIEKLTKIKNLKLGCMFDLRCSGNFIKLKELITTGEIGCPVTISINAQHPLALLVRPKWYFEKGMHGGTINDIGIHAVELALWLTDGKDIEILAAKEWNKKSHQYPHFKDAAQFMLMIDKNVGVMVDVSYLAPDKIAYSSENYWNVVIHGVKGYLETSCTMPDIYIATDTDESIRKISKSENRKFLYVNDFMREIEGCSENNGLTTEAVLKATKYTLLIQDKANKN